MFQPAPDGSPATTSRSLQRQLQHRQGSNSCGLDKTTLTSQRPCKCWHVPTAQHPPSPKILLHLRHQMASLRGNSAERIRGIFSIVLLSNKDLNSKHQKTFSLVLRVFRQLYPRQGNITNKVLFHNNCNQTGKWTVNNPLNLITMNNQCISS